MDLEGDDDCLSNTEQDESDPEFNYDVTKEHWDVNSEEILRDFNQDVCSDLDMPEFSTSVVTTFSTFLFLWATFYGISATALNHLINFLHYMFSLLSSASPNIAALLAVFPTSLHMLKMKLNLSKDPFEKYVICPSCCSLYTFEECLQTDSSGRKTPKTCNYIAFRQHPIASYRKPCGLVF